jgi:hypothetical protein
MQRVAMVSSVDHYLIANMAYPNKWEYKWSKYGEMLYEFIGTIYIIMLYNKSQNIYYSLNNYICYNYIYIYIDSKFTQNSYYTCNINYSYIYYK